MSDLPHFSHSPHRMETRCGATLDRLSLLIEQASSDQVLNDVKGCHGVAQGEVFSSLNESFG